MTFNEVQLIGGPSAPADARRVLRDGLRDEFAAMLEDALKRYQNRAIQAAEVIEQLEPTRIGHGVKAAYDPRTMGIIRERGITLEICPTSNLNTRVVADWDEFRWIFDTFRRNDVRFTISTDGPEMLQTYIRDELKTLGRLGIMSVEEQEQVAAVSMAASFVPNVSDVPLSSRQPATRKVVEREEA